MKVLILTMAHETDDEVFTNYKRVWDAQITSQKYPIDVLYLYTDEALTDDYVIRENQLITKYPENYWEALLLKVLNGFDYFVKSDYDLVFKTNLSTIINYDVFYQYCLNLDKSRKYVYDGVSGGNFVSGAGMLLNKESAQLVLNHRDLFGPSWTDDLFIGHVLCDLYGIVIESGGLTRYDITTPADLATEELVKSRSHIRIKVRRGNRDIEMTDEVYEILKNSKKNFQADS
jgi:hypothetical protein